MPMSVLRYWALYRLEQCEDYINAMHVSNAHKRNSNTRFRPIIREKYQMKCGSCGQNYTNWFLFLVRIKKSVHVNLCCNLCCKFDIFITGYPTHFLKQGNKSRGLGLIFFSRFLALWRELN